MGDLIGRKPVKLYQARVISIDDVEKQREFAKSCEVKITLDQAWQLVVDKVKKALLRDIDRHIELKALDNGDGTILTEASIWIEVPEGGADNG